MQRIAVPILGFVILAVAACGEVKQAPPFATSSASPQGAPSPAVTPSAPSVSNTTMSNDQMTRNADRSLTTPQSRVSAVQSDLAALGYNPGPIDGKIGPKTRAAVRKYQQDHGMKADGRISVSLEQALRTQRQTAGR